MNKSEELCKLLGIEPRYIVSYIFIGKRKNSNIFETFKQAKNYSSNITNSKINELYPDLTKPSNFMKLLELDIEEGLSATIKDFYKDCGRKKFTLLFLVSFDTDREQFIENLIKYLGEKDENILTYGEKIKELVKHQAQQIEWEY